MAACSPTPIMAFPGDAKSHNNFYLSWSYSNFHPVLAAGILYPGWIFHAYFFGAAHVKHKRESWMPMAAIAICGFKNGVVDCHLHIDIENHPKNAGLQKRSIMIKSRHVRLVSRFLVNRFRKLHPFEIQAYITSACNQRCVYCLCPDVKTKSLTKDQWKYIIRRLGALGILRFKFQGGEPTLRKDFRELCREAQALGMITATVTNGILIVSQPELLDYVDELVVSLDSTRESVNDSIRGPGAYRTALGTIDIALERGIRTFVNMVLIRKNFFDVEDMLAFCEKKGVLLNVQPAMFDRKYFVGKNPEISISDDESKNLNHRLSEWKSQGRGLLFSAWAYKKAGDWPSLASLTKQCDGFSSCIGGKFYFHIEPNGDVHPCGLHGADFSPKNIIQDGFDEAFQNARRHNCGDCWMPFMNERKAAFGLKLSAIREFLRRN